MDCKKAAEKIFKAIKEEVSATRKYNKENPYKREISIEFSWDSRNNSIWNGKEWVKRDETYEIYSNYGNKPLIEGITFFSEMNTIFANLRTLLDEQKKVKGWGNLIYSTERVENITNSWYNRPSMVMVTKVEMPDAPCKEYNALQNYLNKYGVRMENGYNRTYPMNLTNFTLYSVYAGGKRGVLWGEEGTRNYLDNKPKRCAEILETLRKHRTSKDTMICIFGKEEYIDPIDKRYSQMHEVECDGEIRSYVNIIIKSDKGKTKCDIKVY